MNWSRPAALSRFAVALCIFGATSAHSAPQSSAPITFVQYRIANMAFDLPAAMTLDPSTPADCGLDRCEWRWTDGRHAAHLLRRKGGSLDEGYWAFASHTNAFGLEFGFGEEDGNVAARQAKSDVDGFLILFDINLGGQETSRDAIYRFAASFRTDQQLRDLELVAIAPNLSTATLRNSEGLEFSAQPGQWLGRGSLEEILEDHVRLSGGKPESPDPKVLRLQNSAHEQHRRHHVTNYSFELPSEFPMQSPTWDFSVDSREKSWEAGERYVALSESSHAGSAEGPELVNARGDRFRVEVRDKDVKLKLIGTTLHLFVSMGNQKLNLLTARHLVDSFYRTRMVTGLQLLDVSADLASVRLRNVLGKESTARIGDEVAEDEGQLSEIHPDRIVILQRRRDINGGWMENSEIIRLEPGPKTPNKTARH